MLLVWRSARFEAEVCRMCAAVVFHETHAHNMTAGWWGVIAPLANASTAPSATDRADATGRIEIRDSASITRSCRGCRTPHKPGLSVAGFMFGHMFESGVVAELAGLVDRLAALPAASGDGERVDRIAVLEKVKAAAAAAQLGEVAAFADSQQAANVAAGVQARQARRGVPEQVGMARRVAPATAARQVSQAQTLIEQLPETFALLRRGEISEWVATLVVGETSHLHREDRVLVDKYLATGLPGLSPRRAQGLARRLAIEADPAAAVARAGKALLCV